MTKWAGLTATLLLTACTTPHLAEFERTLAAQDSATAALGQWCQARRIADPPTIRAEQLGTAPHPSPEVRRLLGVSDSEALAFRHVRLACGGAVLSEADNWYVPGRLTEGMNRTLEGTQTPFGRVVAPLGFKRERMSATRGRASGCPKGTVLSHRARLILPDGRPISLVTECYTRANLAR
jgi:chorismate-pyruvate lyase